MRSAASLYKKLSYDFIRDTDPVASIMQLTNMLVVANDVPVKTVQEFIDYCKANPGKISYASSGNGTSVHMSAELFKAMTKCDMLHVPYRGSAAAIPDIISNKVQLIFDNLPTALEQVRGGTLRGLGVTSPKRWPTVPDIPAIAETVPGFESVGFYGISAPKGTPPEIIATSEQGGRRGAEGSEAGGAARRDRRHSEADDAGRIRQARRGRDREVAQGGRIRRGFGGLGAALRDHHAGCKRRPHRCRPLCAAVRGGACSSMVRAGRS